MELIYLNLYQVTRHYGGPEEGGWYYDAGHPLASIPFRACRENRCYQECENECSCLEYPDKQTWQDMINAYRHDHSFWEPLTFNDPYGTWVYPSEHEAIQALEKKLPHAYQLVPLNFVEVEAWQFQLMELFSGIEYNSVGLALGGIKLEFRLETMSATLWSSSKPSI